MKIYISYYSVSTTLNLDSVTQLNFSSPAVTAILNVEQEGNKSFLYFLKSWLSDNVDWDISPCSLQEIQGRFEPELYLMDIIRIPGGPQKSCRVPSFRCGMSDHTTDGKYHRGQGQVSRSTLFSLWVTAELRLYLQLPLLSQRC